MITIKMDTKKLDQIIRSTRAQTQMAIVKGVRSAARKIRTQVENNLIKVVKVEPGVIKDRVKHYGERDYLGESAWVVNVKARWVPYEYLHPLNTPSGVVFRNPLTGGVGKANRKPKTFVLNETGGRRYIASRKGKARKPLTRYPEIWLSDVYRKRIGDKLNPLFSAILTRSVAEKVYDSFAYGNRVAGGIILDKKGFMREFKKRIQF